MGALDGKVALVTGGAGGIGAATAQLFADEGATVVVADLDAAGGEKVAAQVGGTFVELDVTEPSAWTAAVDRLTDAHGRLDLAHLNAGVHTGVSDITQLDESAYRRLVSVNVDGVFFGMQAALRLMRAGGSGAIVATASLAGLIAYPIDPAYNLSKHAVVGLVRGVAPVAGPGITVNCVNPGIVDTPMLGAEGKALLEQAGFPVIPPADVARAVLAAATSGRTGEAWVVQPGVIEAFRFPNVPGPRVAGAEGKTPPIEPS